MSLLKKLSVFLFVFVIGFSSCGDDDCAAPAISENIIGTWDTTVSSGEVEFKSDGTYIDNNDALLGVEINGVVYDDRTYVVNGDSLVLTVSDPNGSGESSIGFEVTQNECDEIKLSFDIGTIFTETLVRK